MQRNRIWLEEERARLENNLTSLATPLDAGDRPGLGTHMADQASEVFEQTKNQALRQTLGRTLESVNRALDKMDGGVYAVCDGCGGRIDPARLKAHPYATLCMACQKRAERPTPPR